MSGSDIHQSGILRWIMEAPFADWAFKQMRNLLIGAISQGPVPKHVAFVMDGNRRFAREHHLDTVDGHHMGFEALARILEVCYKSGVQVVTIYAFSIENFKRPKYEVDALMNMAKTKLSRMAEHGQLLDQYGAKVRFLGQRSLLSQDVLDVIDDVSRITAKNNRAILNVCFPYTSRNEITHAIRETVRSYSTPTRLSKGRFSEGRIAHHLRAQNLSSLSAIEEEASTSVGASREPSPGVKPPTAYAQEKGDAAHDSGDNSSATLNVSNETSPNLPASEPTQETSQHPSSGLRSSPQPSTDLSLPDPEQITADTLTSHMFTADNPPLDILIRTSGVERLSDFMMWQCHENTWIVFLECMWPEFELRHFVQVLIEWQWRIKKQGEEAHHGQHRGRRKIKST